MKRTGRTITLRSLTLKRVFGCGQGDCLVRRAQCGEGVAFNVRWWEARGRRVMWTSELWSPIAPGMWRATSQKN